MKKRYPIIIGILLWLPALLLAEERLLKGQVVLVKEHDETVAVEEGVEVTFKERGDKIRTKAPANPPLRKGEGNAYVVRYSALAGERAVTLGARPSWPRYFAGGTPAFPGDRQPPLGRFPNPPDQ